MNEDVISSGSLDAEAIHVEEEGFLQRLLQLRREIHVLQDLAETHTRNDEGIDFNWVANFDRSLLSLYKSEKKCEQMSLMDVMEQNGPEATQIELPSDPKTVKSEVLVEPRTKKIPSRATKPKSRSPIIRECQPSVLVSDSAIQPKPKKQKRDVAKMPREVRDLCSLYSVIPPASCPINADIRAIDFKELARVQKFDAIVIDPPWDLIKTSEVSHVTRGIAIVPSLLLGGCTAHLFPSFLALWFV